MHSGKRVDHRGESGQVLVLMAAAIAVLIAVTGFAIDVGHAYLVQRQLQAAIDAAALAGAQELPDVTAAKTTAIKYGPNPGVGQRNGLPPSNTTVTDPPVVKCVVAVGCSTRRGRSNAIMVKASSVVPTIFAKVVGVDSFKVHASATACSPCSSKKFDVMIVLDRTGSMQGQDLLDAKSGIEQFLLEMDPSLDAVGLAVFPPAVNSSSACATPTSAAQRYGYNTRWPGWTPGTGTPGVYALVPPAQDYLVESSPGTWRVNRASAFKRTLDCVAAGGTTSYANALAEAKHELKVRGRSDAQDIIVFFTDGAANTMPAHGNLPAADGLRALNLEPYGTVPPGGALKPCQAGVVAARWAKDQDSTVYTIGYDIDGNNGGSCGDPGYTATTTLEQMSSGDGYHYVWRPGLDLSLIFVSIAQDILKPEGRLIDDSLT